MGTAPCGALNACSNGRARMPNKPRPENRHRMVRVEDELWESSRQACAKLGTTRAEVMREALRQAVRDAEQQSASEGEGA